jgi:alkylated DNA repair protein alkB family protein 1
MVGFSTPIFHPDHQLTKPFVGVPRIMEGTLPPHFAPCEGDECMLAAAKRWIASARININARQVFPPGFQRPDRA